MERAQINFNGKLTPRMTQVLDMTLAGFYRKEMAEIMGISYKTIKDHFGRITVQFGMRIERIIVEYYMWKNGLKWAPKDKKKFH